MTQIQAHAPFNWMTEIQYNDLFWTLQGEGHNSGRRALFVRLPFCNYDCPWCDTEYNSYKKISEEDFLNFAKQEPARFAVITGGEPLAHKHLDKILGLLKYLKFEIACETNGSFPAPKEIDFVTCSPKSFTKKNFEPYYIHPDLYGQVSEFKYVVDEDFNFDLLKRHENDDKKVIHSLSPEFNKMNESTERIMTYIKENPKWRLSLQTHKWIQIP